MIIAIDGPAASGKGTLGKRIAAHYSLIHLDTGKLYRAVARDTLAAGASPAVEEVALAAAEALDLGTLGDPFLMDGRLGEAASIVASHPAVREALLAYQRAFARRKPGAVLDGRDIGTVICPEADVKLFVTADPRGARPAPPPRAPRGRQLPIRGRCSGRYPSPRRTRQKPGRGPLAPGGGRALARHHEFGYRRRVQGSHRFDRCCDGPCGAGRLRLLPILHWRITFSMISARVSERRRVAQGCPGQLSRSLPR